MGNMGSMVCSMVSDMRSMVSGKARMDMSFTDVVVAMAGVVNMPI